MRFTDEFIEKVRDASNIVEVIGQHTQLKKTSSNYSGLCPFPDHKEKTPSFSVSDTKQAYHCFGCKRGGNVITFLRDYQGLTFIEAVELLAERANIPLPVTTADPSFQKADERKKDLLKLNRDAAGFYHQNLNKLPESHHLRQYIKTRGLSPETVEQFMLGYAPDAWSEFSNSLKSSKQKELAEQLGLIRLRTKGDGHYDIFRNRFIFPIISPLGEALGFGGRVLDDGQPKYLNSSESPVFSKGRVFYGLNESSKYIRAEDSVIVVEGYMDFLALFQAGVRNVVATLGTALTEEHAKLLKRYTRNVIVLFDGDAAGQSAADRSLPILLKAELLPRGFALPDGLDPDEYVQREGGEKLKAETQASPDLFVSFVSRLSKKLGGRSTDKVRFMEIVKPVLTQMPDSPLRDLYLEELATRLGVRADWVKKSLAGKGPIQAPFVPTVKPQVPNKTDKVLSPIVPPPNDEKLLLGLALAREDLLQEIISSHVEVELAHSLIRDLMSKIVQRYGQRPSDFDKLASILSSEIDDPSWLTQHLDPKLSELTEDQGTQLVRDCIQKVKQRFLKSQARAIINDLKTEQDPKKLEQFVNIIRDRKALDNE
ncbi:MAG: DNA primase [Bdellovibrionia bacterium]